MERLPGCSRFVVLDDPGWEKREAIDLPEEPGPLFDEPALDWYSEQERFTALGGGVTDSADLRFSGHA